MIKPWRWVEHGTTFSVVGRVRSFDLFDGRGRTRCSIWERDGVFTWHTWDENGTGGENSYCNSLNDAKDQAVAAIVRQGWAPGRWEVQW